MKSLSLVILLLSSSQIILAQNEVGPDGDKLIYSFLVVLGLAVIYFVVNSFRSRKTGKVKQPFFKFPRVSIELEKDRLYYPDNLDLTVKNTGNTDIDLDRPLLVFDNFWLKRKFRIKGMESRTFYPLYLEKGKLHTLQIDLDRFYFHDKRLKKFPKIKISVFDMKGKRLGSKSIFLRKTLFRF